MNYCGILKETTGDGEGVRVSLYVSGCRVCCPGCHNPETWPFDAGKPFDENAKREIFAELDRPYVDGLTLTGGHPLDSRNLHDCLVLVKEVKEKYPSKNVWVYTGYVLEDMVAFLEIYGRDNTHVHELKELLLLIDALVDGPYVESLRNTTIPFRGSTNQRILKREDITRALVGSK